MDPQRSKVSKTSQLSQEGKLDKLPCCSLGLFPHSSDMPPISNELRLILGELLLYFCRSRLCHPLPSNKAHTPFLEEVMTVNSVTLSLIPCTGPSMPRGTFSRRTRKIDFD